MTTVPAEPRLGETILDRYLDRDRVFDRLFEDADEQEREGAWNRFCAVGMPLRKMAAERRAIIQSGDLTESGKSAMLASLPQRHPAVTTEIAKAERALQAAVDEIERIESTVIGQSISKLTPEELAHDREVRDVIRTKSRAEAIEVYLRAAFGGDHATVRAIEGAPEAFPLVDEAAKKRVRQVRVENSPAFPRIQRLRGLVAGYAHLIDVARRDLGGRQ